MNKTYRASPYAIEKLEKRKKSETAQCVLYAMVAFFSLIFRGDEQVYSLARDYETSPSNVRSWLTVFLVVSAVLLIVSIVLAVIAERELERLRCSYITLSDEGVSGMSIAGKEDSGREFFVKYCEIVNAMASYGEGNNLVIHTRHISYPCWEINCADQVAELINKKIENPQKALEKIHDEIHFDGVPSAQSFDVSENDQGDANEAHFLNCDSEYVICPFCDTKQRSNRECCYECGATFVFEHE